jgi:hypothetical protein
MRQFFSRAPEEKGGWAHHIRDREVGRNNLQFAAASLVCRDDPWVYGA